MQRGHGIALHDFNLKCFVQKLRCICLPPSSVYLQYKYGMYITSVHAQELDSGHVRVHILHAWSEFAYIRF